MYWSNHPQLLSTPSVKSLIVAYAYFKSNYADKREIEEILKIINSIEEELENKK